MNKRLAIQAIDRFGICLVFPKANEKTPPSLWSHFFPRSKMRWEWDQGGDTRVADLWHLREELSRSGKVVYGKWYQGRATFFSRDLFPALYQGLNLVEPIPRPLIREASEVLGVLEENSPLSTKALKAEANLQGKFHEKTYSRALRELWSRLLIVGYGEVDDGAFPSLSMGATRWLFEDLWNEANEGDAGEFSKKRESCFEDQPLCRKFFDRFKRAARPFPSSPGTRVLTP